MSKHSKSFMAPGTPQRRRAFTLIELLVVVAIIGVLAGLVTAVTARSRKVALRVEAIGKLRTVGMALQSYINDNDGSFPGPLRGYQKPTRVNNYQLITRIEPYLSELRAPDAFTINDLYVSNAYKDWISSSSYNAPSAISGADAYVMYTNHTDPQTGTVYQPFGEPNVANAIKQTAFYVVFNPTRTRAMWDAQGTVRSPDYEQLYPGRNVLFFDWHVENVAPTAL